MALVAYDNSDCSDYDEDNENATVATLNSKVEVPYPPISKPATANKEIMSQVDSSPSLFNLLPQPSSKRNPSVIEEDDEFLHKKEENTVKPKAKITVPSLTDFKDVKHSIPIAKPKTTNGIKSGLLSILPQPRNAITITSNSLIPHVLTQKINSTVKNDLTKPQVLLKKSKLDPTPLINDYSDDSDNEEVTNDFFSINKPVVIPEDVEVPLDIAPKLDTMSNTSNVDKPRGIESFFKKDADIIQPEQAYDELSDQSEAGSNYNGYGAKNSNDNEMVLDEEAIMKLCGARGKRKREDIQIVDVNQQEVLAGARELLLKGLMDDTTKRVSASKKKGHEPTSQQRRKHQITYLAYQAKANEADLQNQWANNRMSKRQTQAKYGF